MADHEPSLLACYGHWQPPKRDAARTVPVLLPLALNSPYDYLVQGEIDLRPGDFVSVPLGSVTRTGVVWHEHDGSRQPVARFRLKPILGKLEEIPPLPLSTIEFLDWVARYTLSPRGAVLQMAISASAAFQPEEPHWGFKGGNGRPAKTTPARERVLDAVADGRVWRKKELAIAAAAGPGVIEALAECGALLRARLQPVPPPRPNPKFCVPLLSIQQNDAVAALRNAAPRGRFSPTLLHGVTGSGKTEVYFEAVAEALQSGAQVLILLPEIALTAQFLDRFAARFGCRPREWHSSVSAKERGRVWRGVATGTARVVAGARSALFLPFCDLGLIVVDEEHDSSFKQDERVTYQARDMAVARASLGSMPIVLSSATPSIETMVNAKRGRYAIVSLKTRFSGQDLPRLACVNLKEHPPEKGTWLSPPVVEAVTETLGKGEQALLFLNRRGYAPLTLCRGCGYRFHCPQCSAYLVEHRLRGCLTCHHCGFSLPFPKACPSCRDDSLLTASGPGVERIMEEVTSRWPAVRSVALSSDLLQSTVALREALKRVEDGDVDIVVGTQLVSKGHNFPKLSFAGIVDGDLSLATADPRASERTFQLLHQVTGRAGRFATDGHGLIQTHYPDHPVMKALVTGDLAGFYDAEIAVREEAHMPPFGRLAALLVSAPSHADAERYARALSLAAPTSNTIEVLGPVEAPLAILRGRHRQRLLVKAPRNADIQGFLSEWLKNAPAVKGSVKLQIDIDPYNFL